MSTRILIADDHRIVREGLRSLLEKQPDFEVVAEAEDGRTALKLAREIEPDVVIMDIAMPDLNGIEATRQIVAKAPGVKVLALSMYADRQFISGMLIAGASGYMLKDCAFDELVSAIHAVCANQTYLSPRIGSIVVGNYIHCLQKDDSSAFSLLTGREREVLQLLAEGQTTKAVADKLQLSVKTIETYRQRLMNKLKVHSLAELTKYAIREGLASLET